MIRSRDMDLKTDFHVSYVDTYNGPITYDGGGTQYPVGGLAFDGVIYAVPSEDETLPVTNAWNLENVFYDFIVDGTFLFSPTVPADIETELHYHWGIDSCSSMVTHLLSTLSQKAVTYSVSASQAGDIRVMFIQYNREANGTFRGVPPKPLSFYGTPIDTSMPRIGDQEVTAEIEVRLYNCKFSHVDVSPA